MVLNYKEEYKANICLPNWKGFWRAARKPFSPLMTFALIFLYLILDGVLVLIATLRESNHKTCYGGHAFGLLSGFIVGIIILENRIEEPWENILRKVLLCLYYTAFLSMAIMHFSFLTEKLKHTCNMH